MSEQTCGEALPFLLKEYGVDTVFGMPGVHSLEFYRTLDSANIRHIGVRHEQGAGFMADGYARACGRPGVCILISGPGVTNVSTALGQAYSDSIPILALTTVIARQDIGMNRGMLHEINDQRSVTSPITGISEIVWDQSQTQHQIARAFAMFSTGRPRPVHLSFPLDVLEQPVDRQFEGVKLPVRPRPCSEQVAAAASLLGSHRKIIFLFGGGAIAGRDAAIRLVEKTGALAVTTIAGKGIVPDSHPQSLGSTLQRISTQRAIAAADLVIAVGTEISEPDLYVTADAETGGGLDSELTSQRLKLGAQLVRIDIDYQTVIRDYPADIAILADARATLESLDRAIVETREVSPSTLELAETIRVTNQIGKSHLESVHVTVLDAVHEALPADALIYADMTQIAYTGCVFYPVEEPGCWHFPMGYGTLGYALPAAIGGSAACPGRACAALVGDGGLMFTLQEIATAVELGLPLPIIVWDNNGLGEIADFMKARDIPQISVAPMNPDFPALAKSFGALTAAPKSLSELSKSVRVALSADRPTLIHVVQDHFA